MTQFVDIHSTFCFDSLKGERINDKDNGTHSNRNEENYATKIDGGQAAKYTDKKSDGLQLERRVNIDYFTDIFYLK